MDKIEEKHLEAINSSYELDIIFQDHKAASKSAEITEQVSVGFIQWMANNYISMSTKRRDSEQFYYQGKEISPEKLFQEFLKTL